MTASYLVLALWLVVIGLFTLTPRGHSAGGVDLQLLNGVSWRNLVGNVVLFVPLGAALAWPGHRCR